MYATIEDVFPIERLERLSRPGGIRLGVSANVAGHTRELLGAVCLAMEDWSGTASVEAVWANDGRDGPTAQRVAREFISRGCQAVIGHLSASASVPAARVYDGKCLLFAPATSHPDLLAAGASTCFRIYQRDDSQARAMVELAATRALRGRVALVEQPIAYGRALAELIHRAWPDTPQLTRLALPPSAIAVDPVVEQLRQLRPDVLLFAGIHEAAADLLRRLGRDEERLVVLSDDAYTADFLPLAGDSAEGAQIMAIEDARRSSRAEELQDRFTNLTGELPGAYFLSSYAAMEILLTTARDSAAGQAPRAMAERIRTRSWDTCIGELGFGPQGEVIGIHWGLLSVRDGEFLHMPLEKKS